MTRPYRILALSGGGFLGLYTAVVLQGLEARAGVPLARRFDLIAGTSIGGVLALALAFELRPGIVAANQLLLDIARAQPKDTEALATVPGMRRYQVAAFGEALLMAI